MLVELQNTQGIDMTLLALVLGIVLVIAAAIGVVLVTRRGSRKSRRRPAASSSRVPPKKKKSGRGPQIVEVRPRGEEAPEEITPEVDENMEEIL